MKKDKLPNSAHKGRNWPIFVVDVLFSIAVGTVLTLSTLDYRSKIDKQNISDISNINRSSANLASAYFESEGLSLNNRLTYLSKSNSTKISMSYDEAKVYLSEANSNPEISYMLLGDDYKGTVSLPNEVTSFPEVDYSGNDYTSIQSIVKATDRTNAVSPHLYCTAEFTDRYSGFNSFALYGYVSLLKGGVSTNYTLFLISKSTTFSGFVELNNEYDKMATTIMNFNGDYVFGSPDFKATNLFSYFATFNGLGTPEANALRAQFQAGTNIFYYKNNRNENCVFVLSPLPKVQFPTDSWYCVSVVPLSSYQNGQINYGYTLSMVFLLVAMMIINILWLAQANRRLRESALKEREANGAKTDFLSRMSHDIRTPLNVIIGTAILAERQDNPPATAKYIGDIQQSGKFLLSLVNDVLNLNKVESGKMELHLAPYSLSELAQSVKAIIEPLCQAKDITLTVDFPEGNESFLLDSVRINQIFYNLLSNSTKFTPAGGKITLTAKVVPGNGDDRTLLFVVSDTGIGMSEEFQKKMFDPFTQEQRSGTNGSQGTGLGLAIVSNLLRLMKGEIRVESALNQGTRFTLSIPTVKADQPSVNLKEEKAASLLILKGKRVLLFEDNLLNANIAKTLLEDKGMIVEHAENGEIGLKLFEASPLDYYDLILMDMRMPVMGGLEATKALRSLTREDARRIPVVAMTANAYDVDVQNCLDAGMNAHLSKPIDPELMYSTLATQLSIHAK